MDVQPHVIAIITVQIIIAKNTPVLFPTFSLTAKIGGLVQISQVQGNIKMNTEQSAKFTV